MAENFELIGCTGKQAFTDRHLARKAAERRHGRIAYRCQCCGLWHVANTVHRRRKMHKHGHHNVRVG